MSLDALGRAAGETLTTQSALGLEADVALARLDQTRRHRSQAKVGLTSLTVVAILVSAFVALGPTHQNTTPVIPTDPSPYPNPSAVADNGPIALVDERGDVVLEDQQAGSLGTVLVRASDVSGEIDNTSIAWSVDGQDLIYATRSEGKTEIIKLNPTSGRATTLSTCGPGCAARLSPDQQTLAITEMSRLSVVDLATGERRDIYRRQDAGIDHPSWAPDGSAIAIVEELNETSRLLVVDLSGKEEPRVLVEGSGAQAPSWPEWSPTGATIAFLQAREPFLSRFVTTISSRGGPVTPLFPAGEADMGSTEQIHRAFHDQYPAYVCNYGDANTPESVAWSPDGNDVVVRSCAGTFWAPASPGQPPRFIFPKAYSNPSDPPDFGRAAWRPVP